MVQEPPAPPSSQNPSEHVTFSGLYLLLLSFSVAIVLSVFADATPELCPEKAKFRGNLLTRLY